MTNLWKAIKSKLRQGLRKLRQQLPYVVWYGQEVDVRVIFPNDTAYLEWLTEATPTPDSGVKLTMEQKEVPPVSPIKAAFRSLKDAGIDFLSVWPYDKKVRGSEWHLGPSLKGPMRIKFVGTTQNVLARTE